MSAQRDLPMKRAAKQERKAAKDIGGRRQPGSGSQWHSKGDAKGKRFLVENKFTDAQQYVLKVKDVLALRKKALFEGREWCMQIDIGGMKLALFSYNALLELESEDST